MLHHLYAHTQGVCMLHHLHGHTQGVCMLHHLHAHTQGVCMLHHLHAHRHNNSYLLSIKNWDLHNRVLIPNSLTNYICVK